MINYIKTHKLTYEDFKKIDEVLWNDDKYMKPVEIDAWLMFGKYYLFKILWFKSSFIWF